MSVRVLTGDCRDVLRTLAEQSFHTVVTSPPYFGLRDYGHEGQLGLEPTPDEFVAALVAVFREVRRVLRDDGTVWLNLGTSYMTQPGKGDNVPQTKWKKNTYPAAAPHRVKQSDSDGRRASPSRQPQHDPAYGTDGTEPRGCSAPDCVYRGRDDEPLGGSPSHHGRTAHSGPAHSEDGGHLCTTGHDSEHLGCAEASPAASPHAARASKSRASWRRDRAACVPVATASASQPSLEPSSGDAPLSADTSACTCGTGSTSAPSDQSMSDKSSSGLACDCGSCGICWASLAIPLLRLKPKDEINIPHFVAMALQADGWFLRQTIIWSKPNPMPESVRDRCTKAHEYLFLLSKSPRYYFDQKAIAEPVSPSMLAQVEAGYNGTATKDFALSGAQDASATKARIVAGRPQLRRAIEIAREKGLTDAHFEAIRACGITDVGKAQHTQSGFGKNTPEMMRLAAEAKEALGGYYREFVSAGRNRRSVWTITTQPYSEAHFATFPPALVEPCIKAGCPVGGNVLDPFGGAGTTGLVADRLQRNATLIELNPAYAEMARGRLSKDGGMFAEVAAE